MTASADLRSNVAQVLAGLGDMWDQNWNVYAKPSDAIAAPAFLLVWGWGGIDLWREPSTMASDLAHLEVIVAADRVDSDAAHDLLELMVDSVIPALTDGGYRHHGVTVPSQLDIGGLKYLTARIRLQAQLRTRIT